MPLFIVYNPVCGDKSATKFFKEHVVPLLDKADLKPESVQETQREGHAGELISTTLSTSHEEVTIVLGSGDGTLHEIVNELYGGGSRPEAKVKIVLVPCGTANALYSSLYPPSGPDAIQDVDYRLKALKSFIGGAASYVPLSFAVTTVSAAGAPNSNKPLVSSVVISTSLHAAILRDSEQLRDEHPGIERFKIAAQQNSDKWYNARAKLLPLPGGAPQIYDPKDGAFHDFKDTSGDGSAELEGPFAYFLSTVNVDRLEPAFNITPLSRQIKPPAGSCDVIIIRPLRDPSVSADSPEARQAFVPKLWAVLGGAYQEGSHVRLRYTKSGDVVTEGDGQLVVEYARCGGWRWIPDEADPGAHWLCSDGYVTGIGKGQTAESKIPPATEGNIVVCAS